MKPEQLLALRKHSLILGDPGSGKTARGLEPLIAQLVAEGHVSVDVLDAKRSARRLDDQSDSSQHEGDRS